jgi:hypothetical protein
MRLRRIEGQNERSDVRGESSTPCFPSESRDFPPCNNDSFVFKQFPQIKQPEHKCTPAVYNQII